jgi:hypothetical protein
LVKDLVEQVVFHVIQQAAHPRVAEVDLVDLMVVMDMHQEPLLALPMEAAAMVEIMAEAEAEDFMHMRGPLPQQEPEVRVQYV